MILLWASTTCSIELPVEGKRRSRLIPVPTILRLGVLMLTDQHCSRFDVRFRIPSLGYVDVLAAPAGGLIREVVPAPHLGLHPASDSGISSSAADRFHHHPRLR